MHSGPSNLVSEYMPMEKAPLSLEIVILHWGLFTTVHRVHFGGQARQSLCTLKVRVHRHDIVITVFAGGPLPLEVDSSSIVLWHNAQPPIVTD